MKLKQIALAAAMVAATGSAMADVSVYGIVDANVNNSKAEAGSKPLGQLGATLGAMKTRDYVSVHTHTLVKHTTDHFSKRTAS
ncbi:hypothetical protein LN050_03520 [Comamonadaceae bacterium M7527]|nr:hypothetical protein LN050_03520 [Comamonadaceae bacterium M7527]